MNRTETKPESAQNAVGVLVVAADPALASCIIRALTVVSPEDGPDQSPKFGVVGIAQTAEMALSLLGIYYPPLLVLALDQPLLDASVEEVCVRLITNQPDTATLVLLSDRSPALVQLVIGSGVQGIAMTDIGPDALRLALEEVSAGNYYVSPSLVDVVVSNNGHRRSEPNGQSTLTARELAAMQLLSRGYTSKQIARVMETTPKAIDLAIERATKRLGASHRAQAVAEAIRRSLIT